MLQLMFTVVEQLFAIMIISKSDVAAQVDTTLPCCLPLLQMGGFVYHGGKQQAPAGLLLDSVFSLQRPGGLLRKTQRFSQLKLISRRGAKLTEPGCYSQQQC